MSRIRDDEILCSCEVQACPLGSAVYEGQVRILVVGQNVGTRRHRRVDSRKAPGVLPALAYQLNEPIPPFQPLLDLLHELLVVSF